MLLHSTVYNVTTLHSMKHKNPDVWISWRHNDKENSFLIAKLWSDLIIMLQLKAIFL